MSLRVFGEDITVAGREADTAKKRKFKLGQVTAVPEIETEGFCAEGQTGTGTAHPG